MRIERPLKVVAEQMYTAESLDDEIFERISKHSVLFDREILETRMYTPEQVKEAWIIKEWKIGDATVRAIGVKHVPETFLEFRKQIEGVIAESDVIMNEFAPEALGFYDESAAPRLKETKSAYNDHYNLEQLREAYLKYERQWNIGVFHHEIELLVAKYGKEMALADLTMSKNVDAALQGEYIFAYGAEEIAEQSADMKREGLYAASIAAGIAGAASFVRALHKPMTRRQFLKLGLVAGAAAVIASTPLLTETAPRTALKKEEKFEERKEEPDERQMEHLRDPYLAESLWRLAAAGYKNIAFIYGREHLVPVEHYLKNPEESTHELVGAKKLIERENPDAYRVYRLKDGENHSERFTASPHKVWDRL